MAGWIAGFLALGVAVAVFASTPNSWFFLRDKEQPLHGIAAGCGLLLVVVAAVWWMRAARARALYRDGALLEGRVVKEVKVVERSRGGRGGRVRAYHAVVQLALQDGSPRQATLRWLNQPLVNPRVLVLGEWAGVYLPAEGGPHAAIFRMARLRPVS